MKKVIKLNEKDLQKLIRRVIKEEESQRYMFFSNLEQIQRQMGLLLDLNHDQVNEILENGHDWAQDHIATAKESIDQVFDFLMNKTKSFNKMGDELGKGPIDRDDMEIM
jgi:hypothetical protein